jgi:hypothetical protein
LIINLFLHTRASPSVTYLYRIIAIYYTLANFSTAVGLDHSIYGTSMPSTAAVGVPTLSSVGTAAKSDVHKARAPETGEPRVEFVCAFFLARGVQTSRVLLKAILCTTKIKLN